MTDETGPVILAQKNGNQHHDWVRFVSRDVKRALPTTAIFNCF